MNTNFFKKNKKTFLVITIFIILMLLLIPVKNMLFPDSKKAFYGDRLKDIEKYPITEKDFKNAQNKLDKDRVKDIKTRLSGRTVEIIMEVDKEVSLATAKTYGDKILTGFTKEQQKYYTFQIFITQKDSKEFPIIGYKHNKEEKITWTRDRTGETK